MLTLAGFREEFLVAVHSPWDSVNDMLGRVGLDLGLIRSGPPSCPWHPLMARWGKSVVLDLQRHGIKIKAQRDRNRAPYSERGYVKKARSKGEDPKVPIDTLTTVEAVSR